MEYVGGEGLKRFLKRAALSASRTVANGADFASSLIKVAHHGSINASPSWCYVRLFQAVGPANGVVISIDPIRYTGENEVPKAEVVAGWKVRVMDAAEMFKRTDAVELGKHVEIQY